MATKRYIQQYRPADDILLPYGVWSKPQILIVTPPLNDLEHAGYYMRFSVALAAGHKFLAQIS